MDSMRRAGVLLVVNFALLAGRSAQADLIPSADRSTVYDTVLHVRWLANGNLPGTPEGQLGVANIAPGGSMSFSTAMEWLAALNDNGGSGYLGHNNWTLPTTPTFPATDPTCGSINKSGGGSFGFGCLNSDLGSLFYLSLDLHYPDTALPVPNDATGPFNNFQPYLYWSHTPSPDPAQGYHTFSFDTGWTGTNVDKHYIYVLPTIKGNPFATSAPDDKIQASADGKTVYDPKTDVTWLADADLAQTETFGAQCVNPDGTACINPDGSMTHTTAENWISGMNSVAYLGQTSWELPPIPDSDASCSQPNFGFGCTGSPMGELFYDQLGLSPGAPAVPTPNVRVGPFQHLQPYLYWSCSAPYTNPPCQNAPPAPGFEWSFSFGNGFQGTDVKANDLYVVVYFPQTEAQALTEAIEAALGGNAQGNAFLSQAAEIGSAPNEHARAGSLRAFINHVNAQRGKALTPAQADEFIALARAI
jgi:hypothetical protein